MSRTGEAERRSSIPNTIVGLYVRVGRSARLGPIYRVVKLDRHRQLYTVVSLFTDERQQIKQEDLEAGLADGIVHILGETGRDI